MQDMFIGRDRELGVLQKKYDQDGFHMAIVYGRRRIGKTMMINHFIQNQNAKTITFAALERSENELLEMMTESALLALAPELIGTINFSSFEKLFEYIGKIASKERVIFFIDEYPYLAKQCPYIQTLLQKVIDYDWKNTNLFFILCGSLVGFMKDEVLAQNAPLHGRNDIVLKLRSFDYLDTAKFIENYNYEEKAIVYGLTNGVAKYIKQFDERKSLEDNILEQFYCDGGYFSEEQILTVITSDRKNPSLYNSIISAVATGHTKNNEIASSAGADDITFPLKVLVNSEILEKRMSNKPYYILNDSMLIFWFRFVNRASSLINAGRGEVFYYNHVQKNIHDFMGPVFENMARDYLLKNVGIGKVPIMTEVENYQKSIIDENNKQKQIEIDLVGYDDKKIVLAGECKFKNTKFDKIELETFLDKVKYLPGRNYKLFLFSLSGFTDYVKDYSDDMVLVSIEDMYA